MLKCPPERIICLSNETVETIYLLGEEKRIVGVTGFDIIIGSRAGSDRLGLGILRGALGLDMLRGALVLLLDTEGEYEGA